MVLVGTRNIAPLLEQAPMMDGFDAEPWTIERVEILQVTFEVDDSDRESLVPKALHPTIPPAAIFSVSRYPNSPVGPFLLAQVKVSCRAAALPRGFLLRACASTPEARDALGRNWGFSCAHGDVRLQRYHDRIVGSVHAGDGREILRISLVDPEPISGGDVQYVANMNLAKTKDGPVLVQCDPEYTFHRAERGPPRNPHPPRGGRPPAGRRLRPRRLVRGRPRPRLPHERHLHHRRYRLPPHPLRAGSGSGGSHRNEEDSVVLRPPATEATAVLVRTRSSTCP